MIDHHRFHDDVIPRDLVRAGRVAFSASLLIALAGCSTVKLPEYRAETAPVGESSTPAASAQRIERNGVIVAVDPWLDKERTERYFGLDARGAALVILHLRVENRTSGATLLLHKDNMRLLQPGAANPEVDVASTVRRQAGGGGTAEHVGGGLVVVGGALLAPVATVVGLPLIFGGANAEASATVIQFNFTIKELGNQTLSPGQSAEGFVYFRLPENQRLGAGSRFVVSLRNIGSGQTDDFAFALPDEK